jgi:hypothetical protein
MTGNGNRELEVMKQAPLAASGKLAASAQLDMRLKADGRREPRVLSASFDNTSERLIDVLQTPVRVHSA